MVLVFNCKARLGYTVVLWGGVGVWGKGSGVAPPLFSFVVQRNVFLIVISYAVVEEVIVVVEYIYTSFSHNGFWRSRSDHFGA